MSSPDAETTDLLRAWQRGSREAGEQVLARLYPDLHRLAAQHLQSLDLSLQPSDLVQETYLKLAAQHRPSWQSRVHFFAITARLVRRVVVDHLRKRHRLKRRAGEHKVTLSDDLVAIPEMDVDLIALDEVLERLTEIDPVATRVVELRYFAGLTVEETAEILELSVSSVVRRWRFTRAWLFQQLGGEAGDALA